MKNRIDQIFKEKLEHHSHSAPIEAWSKIEAALPKKNSIIVWWRLAAVFLLFGMLVSAIYWLQSNDKGNMQPALAEKKIESISQPVEEKKEESSTTQAVPKQKVMIAKKSTSTTTSAEIQKINVVKDKAELEVIPEPKEVVVEIIIQPAIQETVATTKNEKPIVLEFTLEPIETHRVTQSEEKNSGLKRVWAKAKDIKNGEDVFDLQNLKESLFAFNSKKDKINNNQ